MNSPYAKAIIAFLAALASGLGLVAGDGLTLAEVLCAIGTAAVTSGLVYRIPNTDPEPRDPNAPSPMPRVDLSLPANAPAAESPYLTPGQQTLLMTTRPLPSRVGVNVSTGQLGGFEPPPVGVALNSAAIASYKQV